MNLAIMIECSLNLQKWMTFFYSFPDMTFSIWSISRNSNQLQNILSWIFCVSFRSKFRYKRRTFPIIRNSYFSFVRYSAHFYQFIVRIIQNIDAIGDCAMNWFGKFRPVTSSLFSPFSIFLASNSSSLCARWGNVLDRDESILYFVLVWSIPARISINYFICITNSCILSGASCSEFLFRM